MFSGEKQRANCMRVICKFTKTNNYIAIIVNLILLFNQTSQFPINCKHASAFELGKTLVVHYPTHKCCSSCHFPDFVGCTRKGSPRYLCHVRAIKCVSKCLCKPKKQILSGKNGINQICRKKICKGKTCCEENQCISLKI